MGELSNIMNIVQPLIEAYAGESGILLQALVIMASLRIVFKPLMSLIGSIVLVTPSKSDDILLQSIKAHKGYKMVSYLIDYFASIKLPK